MQDVDTRALDGKLVEDNDLETGFASGNTASAGVTGVTMDLPSPDSRRDQKVMRSDDCTC